LNKKGCFKASLRVGLELPTVSSRKNYRTPSDPVPGPYWPALSAYMSLSALGRFEGVLLNEPGQRPLGSKDRIVL